jgi:hypothetical protein
MSTTEQQPKVETAPTAPLRTVIVRQPYPLQPFTLEAIPLLYSADKLYLVRSTGCCKEDGKLPSIEGAGGFNCSLKE